MEGENVNEGDGEENVFETDNVGDVVREEEKE